MQLINAIEIENFCSIKKCKIKGLKDFNSLFGLNNSGKSNIPRALNLFSYKQRIMALSVGSTGGIL